jgi:hypothetical protein
MKAMSLRNQYLLLFVFTLVCNAVRGQNSPFSGGNGGGVSAITTNGRLCQTGFGGGGGGAYGTDTTNAINCLRGFSGGLAAGTGRAVFIKNPHFLGNDTAIVIICPNETINLLTLFSTVGMTVQWSTANPAAAGIGNYGISVITPSGCTDTAAVAVVHKIARWAGTINSDWHIAANWNTGQVPDSQTHVIVPGGTLFACTISTADAAAASVQGLSGGQLTILQNRRLLVAGNCATLPSGN